VGNKETPPTLIKPLKINPRSSEGISRTHNKGQNKAKKNDKKNKEKR
jgi:hypothetical protein